MLFICGESPGSDEDEQGEPFVGRAGQCLRVVLRDTKVINRSNTIISNVIRCRPPGNKFPEDESASICVSSWLFKEIELTKPKRMMLLGNRALKHVAGMSGISSVRGNWIIARGIRTMPTFHPSYVMRRERDGDMQAREQFERDIFEVAQEVKAVMEGRG